MAASFPASYDALTNPTSGSLLTSPSHATQHINANDIVEAIEQRVGLSGTSFPGSPSSGQFFHRTDRRLDYFYDGTRWLSTTLYVVTITPVVQPFTGTSTKTHNCTLPFSGVYDLWLEDFQTSYYVDGGTALSASHKWEGEFYKTTGGSETQIATISIASGTSDQWNDDGTQALNELSDVGGSNSTAIRGQLTKTGTPGNLYMTPLLHYRIVG